MTGPDSPTESTPTRGHERPGYDPNDVSSGLYDNPYEETDTDSDDLTGPDWLDRAAADLLSVNVSFERIGTAARTGFTTDEARSVLLDPDRLRLLATLWTVSDPGARVLEVAVGDGPLGRLHRMLLSRAGQLAALRSRSRYSLAAGTGGSAEVLVDDLRPARDILITRRIFQSEGLVDVAVEMTSIDIRGGFPVVAILGEHDDDNRGAVVLFLLTPRSGAELGGHCEITLPLEPLLSGEHLRVYGSPVEATELTGTLLAAVPASVAAAKRPWKEVWRQAALATPGGHPLRQAVLDGLAARS